MSLGSWLWRPVWGLREVGRGDVMLAGLLSLLAVGLASGLLKTGHPHGAAGLLSDGHHLLFAACAAGVCGCLIVRRAHPGWAAAAAAVLLGLAGVAGSATGEPFSVLFVPVFALAYSLGADDRLARSVLVLLLLIAGLQLAVGQFNPFVAMVTAGPWAAGLVARSRRQLTEQLTARGRELEAERELFAAESVRYERARIARELHDIVAHCVSVMVIQASAGQRLTATDPSMANEAFESIGEAARQAEAEIGRLAGLLGCDPPARGADWTRLVDELVARASAAGLAVTCRFAGSFGGLSPGAAETAYRLIQESLTNALKHAPGSSADITVHGTGGHVEVGVVNGPPAAAPSALQRAGGGRGLAGMRERLAACGGGRIGRRGGLTMTSPTRIEEHQMRPGVKPAIVLLAVLGVGDLVAVPLMAAAHHHNPNEPPIPAIVATAIIGLVTLASAAGLAQSRRWSFPVAMTCRVLDSLSALLGLEAHPNPALVTIAATILILSVVAIVLLRRLSPRKSRQGEATQPAPGAPAAHLGKER